MEGHLSIWSGLLSGWRASYFILHNDVLVYCTERGGAKEGAIHLKVASIASILDDPLRMCIHTGTNVLQLRAPTVDSRIQWIRALNYAQSEALNNELTMQVRYLENVNGIRQYDQLEKKSKALYNITIDLWNSQAELEELLSQILQRVKGSSTATRMCEKLSKVTGLIKHKTNEAVELLQSYQASIGRSQKLKNLANSYIAYKNNSLEEYKSFSREDYRQRNMAPYHNVSGEQVSFQDFKDAVGRNNNNSLNDYRSFAHDTLHNITGGAVAPFGRTNTGNLSMFHSFDEGKIETPISGEFGVAPNGNNYKMVRSTLKYQLVNSNVVFQKTNAGRLPEYLERVQIPLIVPYTEVNMLKIIGGMVGQDLTRVTLPGKVSYYAVFMNEPLSITQKFCEQLYYSELLDRADCYSEAARRLMFVMAFSTSIYSLTLNRTRKPFNPLLGYTYEFIDPKRKFMYLSEQVSHHPPITAVECDSEHYQFVTNSDATSSFRGTNVKLISASGYRVVLKQSQETVSFAKCTMTFNNLVIGTKWCDNHGNIDYKLRLPNGRVTATGFLEFKECGMFGGNQYEVVGWVKDETGRYRYSMVGKWNYSVTAIDKLSGSRYVLWTKTHQCDPNYYNFNDMAINLNYLNRESLENIAPTDSRLRPDLRAWYFNLEDLAASYKHRLEELQRARRKKNEYLGTYHTVLWFDKVRNPDTGEFEWISNRQYWSERKNKGWHRCLYLY